MDIEEQEEGFEQVSLEELEELNDSVDCPNCGAEIHITESDDWGLCPECKAEVDLSNLKVSPYKPLRFD